MNKFFLPLVGILAASLTGPLLASDRLGPNEIRIRYDKSALNSRDARTMIERRIEFAVNRVCGAPVLGNKEEADQLQDCRNQARATAWAQVPVKVAASRD